METNKIAEINEIIAIFLENDGFAIAGHINPDTDAIGSSLALGLALRKLGKRVNVYLEPFNEKNMIIPGQELICNTPQEATVFIALDCADVKRLGDPFSIMKDSLITICIDHHKSHIPFTQYLYLDGQASSTCEMVYRIVSQMVDIDVNIASAIYAGLLTDTGGFMHNSTSAETMRIAGDLLERNIPFNDIYRKLLKKRSVVESNVLRTALNNMKLHNNGRVAISSISSEEMKSINAESFDTDGISEYLLNIEGVAASAFLYEKVHGTVKASMRSTHIDISKTAIAFGGGGHKQAGGCTIQASIDEAYESVSHAICSATEEI